MKNLFRFAYLSLLPLMLSSCVLSSAPAKDTELYKNDFFGLAIKTVDHATSFEILGYGKNGVKYEYNASKMDQDIIAYGRIDRTKRETVLWLGIHNNGEKVLVFNKEKDHLYLELVDERTFEVDADALTYIDRKKKIEKGEHQQIKVILADSLAALTAHDIGTVTLSVASNFPEIIVLKQLPNKEKRILSVEEPPS